MALTDGELNTIEGCSSISDYNGNLLFYTDGITIWNRNHQPMPNGTGLGGHTSSTQSGIIVPSPASPDIYYVFTVDEAGKLKGLQYNIVDMASDGGLGDVILKNVLLRTPVTEKLTAVMHANGTDIWVVAHDYGNNNFLAYLVTATGVTATPVITAIGHDYEIDNDIRGYMKAAPDGGKIALAGHSVNGIEIFQFDNGTGILSNRIAIDNYFITPVASLFNLTYGIEFSSDSSKLYVSNTIFHNIFDTSSSIYQFNLSNYNNTAVLNSGIQITPEENIPMEGLQLAIDGKIYIARLRASFLSTIDNPNVLGVGSGYRQNGVSLAGRLSMHGLPPFIQSYFIIGIHVQNNCLGDVTEFNLTTNDPVKSISWDFGDGNSSNLENPTHRYLASGTYTVSVTATTVTETKTESKEITIYKVPVAHSATNIEVCTTDSFYGFNLSTKDTEVLGAQPPSEFEVAYFPDPLSAENNTGQLMDLYTNTSPEETIYARIQNRNNPACYATTSFELVVAQSPVVNSQSDWTVCDTDMDGFYTFDLTQRSAGIMQNNDPGKFSLTYHLNPDDADTGLNPLPNSYTNATSSQEIFWRVENTAYPSCYQRGSFYLEVITGVVAHTPADLEVCDDDNDGHSIFDLTTVESEILAAQSATSTTISFHRSPADAENATDPLPKMSYANTVPYHQTLYVRIENSADTTCYDTTSLNLHVLRSPIKTEVSHWQVCDSDDDSTFSFDLQEKDSEILGNQSADEFAIHYFESAERASANRDAIQGLYENTTKRQEIFYRKENVADPACFVIGGFELQVFTLPSLTMPTALAVCAGEDGDGNVFDLSLKDGEVLNTNAKDTYRVRYFNSHEDADANRDSLPKNAYVTEHLQETIYARVENKAMNSCYAISSFELIVSTVPRINLDQVYVICPDSPELRLNGGDFETWIWRGADQTVLGTDQFLEITDLGKYTLTVSQTQNGINCDRTTGFEVVSSGAPEDFTTEISGFSNQLTLTINASGTGEFEYAVDQENFRSENQFTVLPGTHSVTVRDLYLCRTITKEVIALGYQKFFTPNGDGFNETWEVIGMEYYPDAKLYIFDRYGKMLTRLSPTGSGWDGTHNGALMPSSDYWFRFENQEGTIFKGHFALKR